MRPKPRGLGPEYAAQFQDRSVVDAYDHRPPYADTTFDHLLSLIPAGCRRALDIGCGSGDIARPLAQRDVAVDAVDFSEAMIAKGKALPGDLCANLCWIHSRVENASLAARYGLVTAGESLHWMDWDTVLPRLHDLLDTDGFLAIVGRRTTAPWWDDLLPIINRYSTNTEFEPYNLVDELTRRELFTVAGTLRTPPATFHQQIDAYVESFHSRNGLSRDRMTPDHAAAFDRETQALVEKWSDSRLLELETTSSVVWGRPLNPNA